MGHATLTIWGLAAATTVCALQAVRAPRLLHAALWLAGASAFTSILLFGLDAHQAAIIELSVGAGLVFILFVFAISLAGEAGPANGSAMPRPVALCGVGLVVLLLAELAWPRLPGIGSGTVAPLTSSLWADRQLDMLVQIVLIFAGALTIMGFLAQATATDQGQPAAAKADDEPRDDMARRVGCEAPRPAAPNGLRTTDPALIPEESLS